MCKTYGLTLIVGKTEFKGIFMGRSLENQEQVYFQVRTQKFSHDNTVTVKVTRSRDYIKHKYKSL